MPYFQTDHSSNLVDRFDIAGLCAALHEGRDLTTRKSATAATFAVAEAEADFGPFGRVNLSFA